MAAAERIEFMGVIRQQRSRLLDYLLPGHVASRSLDRASCGNSQQAQLQKLWRKQTPAAKALLRSNPLSASCSGMFSSRDRSLLKSATFFSSGQAENVMLTVS
jgi:hypothetical protein